ncbi:hypothetical protein QBC39DRAFT_116213 [Podospora conica]|nr:hypothetical protein QBC39DRAFT_116213 [Schizothecium conicum]
MISTDRNPHDIICFRPQLLDSELFLSAVFFLFNSLIGLIPHQYVSRHAGTDFAREVFERTGVGVSTDLDSQFFSPLALRIRPAISGAGSGFRDGCLLWPAGQLRQAVGQVLYGSAGIVWLAGVPASFFNKGDGSVFIFIFFFLSHKSFVIGSGDCVHKKDWDRLAATAVGGQSGYVLCCWVVLRVFFVYTVYSGLFAPSPRLGPLCPFALVEHRVSGDGRGRGMEWGARFLEASLNLGWTSVRGGWGPAV